jgi:hypothetical protein
MEAVHINNSSEHPLKKVISTFFHRNSLESVQLLFWKMFQCYVTKECTIKAELADEEVALVFDQIIELISVAYAVHEANWPSSNPQEGTVHE